jgi:exo-1,4-beta-D-glucosaminidase
VPNIDGAQMKIRERGCGCPTRILFWVALLSILTAILAGFSPAALADSPEQVNSALELRSGWMLQSSCRVKASGEKISRAGFPTNGWHLASVPSTVVAALVADKTYPDPYFGMNLRSIPGTTYPVGQNFSTLPMPKKSPFRCSWWYRTEFRLPADYAGRHVWLDFDGINNRANIWINGREIASAQEVAGAYRTYEFDVTAALAKSSANVLAVETVAQTEHDLGISWVDWNPAPPDKNLGLWRKVYLRTSGPVTIRYPQVVTHFAGSSLDRADLTVEAELRNSSAEQVSGELNGQIEQLRFQQDIALGPGETRTVRFAASEFPQLSVIHPKIWWPAQMGSPNLHELSLRLFTSKGISDAEKIQFGIREVTSEVDERGHRLFRVNGERILIRGAGWAPDMLLRESDARLKTEFRYIQDLNLNAIRLEGKMETEEFFNLADAQGVLVMAGWSCCDYWEQWQKWKAEDLGIATASLRSQIMRIRSHPSMLSWLNGSDNPPPANVEKAYVEVLKDADWSNPYLSSASGSATTVTGPSGVKMTGPYDYVAPGFWLTADGKYGGAHGFVTETSAGPSVPPIDSLRRMLPESELVQDSTSWNYHAGSLGFKDLSHVEEAMKAIYGAPSGIVDYERKAQAMAYDSERAIFEGYSRNKYEATGIVQWMLNNAWPSLIWHLYDYYLQPAGGYFGAKKACEPLHLMYSYDDSSVEVVNSRYDDVAGLLVKAAVYDIGLRERFSHTSRIDVGADTVARVLTLPEEAFGSGSPVYFVALKLEKSDGQEVSRNFYWISTKKTVYDWRKMTYRYTPATSYEDFGALQSLARARAIIVSANIEKGDDGSTVRVKVQNLGDQLAFQLHLGIGRKGEQTEILPVIWQDNYIELMPSESREITAQFLTADAMKGGAELRVSGWNITPVTIALAEPQMAAKAGGKR